MTNKWKGILTNHCMLQGKISEDPVKNGEYWFMVLKTQLTERDQNGQYVKLEQNVPLMVEPSGPANAVPYIKTGKNLLAWCSYKSWVDGNNNVQHAFVVYKFDLCDKTQESTCNGILTNHCMFQGEVEEDPITNENFWFLNLNTQLASRDQDGRFIKLEQNIPLMVEPNGPVNAMSYIKDGRKLLSWCSYKSWIDGNNNVQHAFVVHKFDLGSKKYEAPQDSTTMELT